MKAECVGTWLSKTGHILIMLKGGALQHRTSSSLYFSICLKFFHNKKENTTETKCTLEMLKKKKTQQQNTRTNTDD